jgi:hypothetical protein
MFDLADRPLVWIPVKWSVLRPGARPKAVAIESEVSIEVEVEILDRDELVELFSGYFSDETVAAVKSDEEPAADPAEEPDDAAAEELPAPEPSERELEVKRFLRVVKSWRKVKEGGRDLDLNEENARKMLRVPGFASAFEGRYLAACAGKADIRRGN